MRKAKLSDLELAKIKYRVFTGDLNGHFTHRYWLEHWPSLIKGLGSELSEAEFFGCDLVTALTLGDEVVGIHLLSRYTRANLRKPGYFSSYPEPVLRALEERRAERLLALKYFMVDEKWSVANTLVNFGAILASLSLKQQLELRCDASVTIARCDLPVATLARKIGFLDVAESQMHNVPVSFMVCDTPVAYPKPEEQAWCERYWRSREIESISQGQRQVA